MIKPGEEWGGPTSDPPDLDVTGSDRDLAAAVGAYQGGNPLVRFTPSPESDLARAVGLNDASTGIAVPLDGLQTEIGFAVNMIVFGTPPERCRRWTRSRDILVNVDDKDWWTGPATTVLIAIGQFRHGLDLVPRGHPGDGWAEIQVYAVPPGERAAMRQRLGTGTHVSHPGIRQRRGRKIVISSSGPLPVEIDAEQAGRHHYDLVRLRPNAYRLLL